MNEEERKKFDTMIGFIIRQMGGEVREPISRGIEYLRKVEHDYHALVAEKALWQAEKARLTEELRVARISNQKTDKLPVVAGKAASVKGSTTSTEFLPTPVTDPKQVESEKIEAKKSILTRLFGG